MQGKIRATAYLDAAYGPRLDAIAEAMRARVPGVDLGRPDALRAAVAEGVEVLEKMYEITPKTTAAPAEKGSKRPRKG